MKWIVLVVFYFLYWGICFLETGTDKKNLIGLRSYPNDVQARVRDQLGNNVPKEKSIPSILLSNFVFFTVLFSIICLVFKKSLAFNSFLSAFWYFLALSILSFLFPKVDTRFLFLAVVKN